VLALPGQVHAQASTTALMHFPPRHHPPAGNLWADVAYNCLPYHLPPTIPGMPVLAQPLPPGVPSEAAYLADYCTQRRLSPPSAQDWAFYLALSLFRWVQAAQVADGCAPEQQPVPPPAPAALYYAAALSAAAPCTSRSWSSTGCTQALLHTDTAAHRHCCTQALLHTGTAAHRHCCTQALLHTGTAAHRHCCTQALLHTDTAAHISTTTDRRCQPWPPPD
jgi:hypothetical protein